MTTYMLINGRYKTATKDAEKKLNDIFMAAKALRYKRILPDGTPLSKEGRDALPNGAVYYVLTDRGETVFKDVVGAE